MNRNRVASTNGTTLYTYNSLGEMERRAGSGGNQRYFFASTGKELTGHLLGQYNPSNSPYNEVIYLDGQTPVGAASTGGTTETRDTALRVFPGHLGEPRRVTDNHMNLAETWDSDAFGNGAANIQPGSLSPFPDDMRLPGQLFFAENGNNFNMSRFFVPVRGRYLQSDRIGLNGGVNTYAYVNNNPANLTDPTGLQAEIVAERAEIVAEQLMALTDRYGPVIASRLQAGGQALWDQSVALSYQAMNAINQSRALSTLWGYGAGYIDAEEVPGIYTEQGEVWSQYGSKAAQLLEAYEGYEDTHGAVSVSGQNSCPAPSRSQMSFLPQGPLMSYPAGSVPSASPLLFSPIPR